MISYVLKHKIKKMFLFQHFLEFKWIITLDFKT
jgi:hypothetical protein